jgi:myosin heavy subunit
MHVEKCLLPDTSQGPILLAVNPFKRLLGMYTEEVLLTYFEQVRRGGGVRKI